MKTENLDCKSLLDLTVQLFNRLVKGSLVGTVNKRVSPLDKNTAETQAVLLQQTLQRFYSDTPVQIANVRAIHFAFHFTGVTHSKIRLLQPKPSQKHTTFVQTFTNFSSKRMDSHYKITSSRRNMHKINFVIGVFALEFKYY